MIVRKTLLAASALALMSTPAWALPSRAPSNQGTKHAPRSTPAGPPSTTPNNGQNPGATDRHSKGDGGNKGASNGSDGGNKGASNDPGPGNQGTADHHGKPGHPSHPSHPSHPEHPHHPSHPGPGHPGKPHKCVQHDVAYISSGTLVSQALSKNPDGTYSGDVTISVTRTNRHAAGDEGMIKTYTLTDARVKLDLADINHDGSVGLDDLQTGDRVKAIGRITTLAKKCSPGAFTATTTIRRIIFHTPTAG